MKKNSSYDIVKMQMITLYIVLVFIIKNLHVDTFISPRHIFPRPVTDLRYGRQVVHHDELLLREPARYQETCRVY